MRISATGSFNAEAVTHYVNSINDCANSFGDTPFSIILDLTSLEGATPDAWQIVDAHNTQLAANPRLIGKGIICQSSLVTYFAGKVNNDKFKSKVKVFASETEALAWLKSKLLISN